MTPHLNSDGLPSEFRCHLICTQMPPRLRSDEKVLSSDGFRLRADQLRLRSDGFDLHSDERLLRSDAGHLRSDELRLSADGFGLSADQVRLRSDVRVLSADETHLSADEIHLNSDEFRLNFRRFWAFPANREPSAGRGRVKASGDISFVLPALRLVEGGAPRSRWPAPVNRPPRVKAFLSAFLLRVLPALDRRAAMTGVFEGAMDSVRRAWAAVAESVAARMPERLPHFTLPTLPFSLPSLPSFSTPPLGRVMSSLGTMMLAPAQLHGLAAYYHLATGDLAPPSVAPAVFVAGDCSAAEPRLPTANARADSGPCLASAAVLGTSWVAPVLALDLPGLPLTAAAALPPSRQELLADPAAGVADHLRICRRGDTWQQEAERGQRPPPAAA